MTERLGRTPFRMELKFTADEWQAFGVRANEANRSRYNFAKRAVLVGIVLSEDKLADLEAQYHAALSDSYLEFSGIAPDISATAPKAG